MNDKLQKLSSRFNKEEFKKINEEISFSEFMNQVEQGNVHKITLYADNEIRGEFKPIQTRVPGIQYGELLPKLSAIAATSPRRGFDGWGLMLSIATFSAFTFIVTATRLQDFSKWR